jgi:hypothetical protein
VTSFLAFSLTMASNRNIVARPRLGPGQFAQRLSDPTRMNYAAVERDKPQMTTTKARVEQIKRQGERVVSLKRGRKS